MNDTTETQTVWHEKRYKAWCALTGGGVPIAASVRNASADVPGNAVMCLITVRERVEEAINFKWVARVMEGENDGS